MKTTYEIFATHEGTLQEIAGKVPGITYTLADVLQTMNELAFIVETVAHLQGKERQLLPTAERARAIVKAFTPTDGS